MSTVPIPKPRALAQDKRPVPLPRTNVPKNDTNDNIKTNDTQVNTLTRRISNTSKQIVEEISGVLQEKLSRQSFTKKNRKSSILDETKEVVEENKNKTQSHEIFNTIRFESPLTIVQPSSEPSSYTEENEIYRNLNNLNDVTSDQSDDDVVSLPPPRHPPPPLPDVSFYDTPHKNVQASSPKLRVLVQPKSPTRPIPIPPFSPHAAPPPTPTRLAPTIVLPSTTTVHQSNAIAPPLEERTIYEAVFPAYPVFTPGTDSESSGNDSRNGTMDRTESTRPESWNFYDPVTLNDVTYMNVNANNVANRSSDSESSVNSELSQLYENYILQLHRRNEAPINNQSEVPQRPERPSKSTIFEFDPLLNAQPSTSAVQNASEIKILDDMFQLELYGTNGNFQPNYDQCSISGDSETGDDFLNPPTPPQRTDSLVDESISSTSELPKKSVWYANDNDNINDGRKSSSIFSKLNDVWKRVPESARNIRAGLHKEKFLDRPSLNSRASYQHRGILFRISSKSVEDLFGEFHFRWLVLSNGVMIFYADNACENPKEHIPLDTILSVQFAPEKKYKLETELFCFEINTSTNRSRGGYVYGIATLQECKHWMQRIAEALTNRFPVNVVMDYTRMGWSYLREGISGTWTGAWIVLSRRHLFYAQDDVPMGSIDLRKARCIQLQEPDADSPKTTDSKGPNLIIDCPDGTVYLRMWTARETKIWCHVTQLLTYKNGRKLEQQQLTKDDVPVIVEKCMNFIYVNGSMSEGIYRRSGSSSVISDVLNQFRANAWAVSLNTEKYSEHDIANVLKRFFRDLPEPLLNEEKSHYLCQIANAFADNTEKVKMYRAVLEHFPKVINCTLKKVLGHLHFIQSQSAKNKMSSMNLASIWGPTLVHHESSELEMNATLTNLLVQLIDMYRNLFPVSTDELNKEKMMLQVLERNFNRQGPQHVRASGDLRVWVHLWDKSGETVIITISPQRLAADVCIELSAKMKCAAFELQLEELVLNDTLRRPVHYSEKVLEVVLRWGYWDESDRKDNCLVLTSMSKYKVFDKPTSSLIVSEELKFSDNKTKSFKNYIFKFEQAKLCYYKETKTNSQIKVQEWNIEDILWYFGFEPRHNPQTKWAITFILRKQPPKRSKAIPYFGNTIGGNDTNMRSKWVSTMIRAEYNNGLAPPLMNIPSES